jgi:hypothetical protein
MVPTWIETKWYKLPNTDVMFKMFCDLRWLQAYSLQVHIVWGKHSREFMNTSWQKCPTKHYTRENDFCPTPKTTFVLPTSASQLRSRLWWSSYYGQTTQSLRDFCIMGPFHSKKARREIDPSVSYNHTLWVCDWFWVSVTLLGGSIVGPLLILVRFRLWALHFFHSVQCLLPWHYHTLIPQVLFEGTLEDHKLNFILFWRNPGTSHCASFHLLWVFLIMGTQCQLQCNSCKILSNSVEMMLVGQWQSLLSTTASCPWTSSFTKVDQLIAGWAMKAWKWYGVKHVIAWSNNSVSTLNPTPLEVHGTNNFVLPLESLSLHATPNPVFDKVCQQWMID